MLVGLPAGILSEASHGLTYPLSDPSPEDLFVFLNFSLLVAWSSALHVLHPMLAKRYVDS